LLLPSEAQRSREMHSGRWEPEGSSSEEEWLGHGLVREKQS